MTVYLCGRARECASVRAQARVAMRTLEADPWASRSLCITSLHRKLGSPRGLCSGGSQPLLPCLSVAPEFTALPVGPVPPGGHLAHLAPSLPSTQAQTQRERKLFPSLQLGPQRYQATVAKLEFEICILAPVTHRAQPWTCQPGGSNPSDSTRGSNRAAGGALLCWEV